LDDYEVDTNGGDGDEEDDEDEDKGEGEKGDDKEEDDTSSQIDRMNWNPISIPWNGVGFDYILSNCILLC
jgi:hypothetical protein